MAEQNCGNAESFTASASPQTKPASYPNRRLIVCCDGTSNTGDDGQPLTNVARIARCVDGKDTYNGNNFIQIVHYQPGPGTGTNKFVNKSDGMTGKGISKAIRAAYSFISLNWLSSDDEIVLIGFSRGAFAVRCVAQFIDEVGLLTKSGLRHLPALFEDWRRLNPTANPEGKEKLEMRCKELREWKELVDEKVQITACAVWDTVKAIRGTFFSTVGERIPGNTRLAIQALALGEKRMLYKPMKWSDPDASDQTLSQYWFAGTHSEVGGGSDDMTLSNITLAWMIGQLTSHVHFNHENLWAITTTRPWSKPSPTYDHGDESGPGSRACTVIASSDISPDLLHSTYDWLSWFMRIGGWGWRDPGNDNIHYSVHILRHLGIAQYTKVQLLGGDLLRKKIPNDDKNKFEGEIMENWAQHILCAHVRLKQARNTAETITAGNPLFEERLKGDLFSDASYVADIPISAILSAFDRLNKDENNAKKKRNEAILSQDNSALMEDNTPSELDRIFQKMEEHSKMQKKRKLFALFLKQPDARFRFECGQQCLRQATASSLDAAGRPKELSIDDGRLVITRTYALLMGRCHTMEKSESKSKASKAFHEATALLRSVKESERAKPCDKCATIWKT